MHNSCLAHRLSKELNKDVFGHTPVSTPVIPFLLLLTSVPLSSPHQARSLVGCTNHKGIL